MTDSKPEPKILNSVESWIYRGYAVLAAMQLDLFTPLRNGPLRAPQIADALGVEMIKLRPLLYSLVVAGLLNVEDECFANTAEADYYLVRGRPSYLGDKHRFFADIWDAALLTAESIRSGKPAKEHDYASMPEDELEAFLHGLYPVAYQGGTWLLQNYEFSSCQTILDAGGGSGGLAIALAEARPQLQVTLVDLPTVAPIAQRFVDRAGATDRVHVKAVDIIRQPLTGSFDAAILKSLVHTMALDEASRALQNVKQVLKPGASIYIWDLPLDDSRLTPEDQTLWSMVFLSIYERGRKYTIQEYRDLLTNAGFEQFEIDGNRIITARKPAW